MDWIRRIGSRNCRKNPILVCNWMYTCVNRPTTLGNVAMNYINFLVEIARISLLLQGKVPTDENAFKPVSH